MARRAVLDANVPYQLPLRDTLLRLAEAGLYVPRWSETILEEVARSLVAYRRASSTQAERLISLMRAAFPEAEVDIAAVAGIEPGMRNAKGDRHVLATAVAAEADSIITFNLRHFEPAACLNVGVEPLHPDLFLCELAFGQPVAVRRSIERQAAALRRPLLTVDQVLDRLAVSVPRFAAVVRGG